MKRTLKKTFAALLAVLLCATLAVTAFAEDETKIYYFVDCGDYVTDTVSDGDQFGEYNTVTDQFFGEDPGTGKHWGVVDEAYDEESSTENGDSRVNTTWTWAYEYNDAGVDVPKESSNRYCHNMTENGLDRVITYKFELPEAGEYVVEVGFSCPWSNSSPVELYLNGELAGDELIFIDNNSTAYGYGTASPVDGYITVEATSIAATINMTYIIISNVLTNEETTKFEPITRPPKDETDAKTDAPTSGDAAGTDQPGTQASTSDDSGCGSALAPCAVIAALTMGAAVTVIKKKR